MSTIPSTGHRLILAGLAFILVLSIGYGSDLLAIRHPAWMIADDLFLATVAAFVVFHYEKERSRFLSEKLRVIREMNAFVRNELQILYASLAGPEKVRIQAVERGVERIDWALRELLPGSHAPTVSVEQVEHDSSQTTERSA